MKARIAFDTLAYANKLKAAGVAPKAAEAQAEANADMIANLLDNTLATKQDITETRSELTREIRETKSDLELKIANLETRLTLRLGAITVASVSIASAIMSMLHATH